ncbi:hypothetical protein [Propionivibrio sp.]|uniref:hypothetical protein n=1 Tax=Propionivibrio sp. TaxID=2212460 RepID=UPI003BF39B1C
MNSEMPRLMSMPSCTAIDPAMIHVVKPVDNKGVFIRNEFNKIIEYIKQTDPVLQRIIVDEIQKVQSQGADWVQPNWDVLFAKAKKETTPNSKIST